MNANPSSEPSEQDVQKEAYLLYMASGCVLGRDLDNWLAARARLASLQSSPGKKTTLSIPAPLHFPLNANASRGPFGTLNPFGNRN
ncbi:MAG: DUF2934 domain-containing protein [Verrucomicrobia bacterium]|nr:DUF2934 domain-containing protein [Verrucomicrobiota bacterium]